MSTKIVTKANYNTRSTKDFREVRLSRLSYVVDGRERSIPF